jgi:hypothetical protein
MPARTKAEIEHSDEENFQKRLETLHNDRRQPVSELLDPGPGHLVLLLADWWGVAVGGWLLLGKGWLLGAGRPCLGDIHPQALPGGSQAGVFPSPPFPSPRSHIGTYSP